MKTEGLSLSKELVRLFGNPMNLQGRPGAFVKLCQRARKDNEELQSHPLDEAISTMELAIEKARDDLAVAEAEAQVEFAKAKVERLKLAKVEKLQFVATPENVRKIQDQFDNMD